VLSQVTNAYICLRPNIIVIIDKIQIEAYFNRLNIMVVDRMSELSDPITRSLGENLKTLRKLRYPRDDQRRFAARIKVSRATYQKMEKGDPSISLGSYLSAAELLGVADRLSQLFLAPEEKIDLLKALDL